MSLLDDLANLDLSTILQARLDISASVGNDGFKLAVSGDFEALALGDLANLAKEIQALDPTNLEEIWNQLLKPILERLNIEAFPIAKLLKTLEEGLEMGGSLLRQIADDPLSLGSRLGLPIPDLLQQFQNTAKNVVNVPLEDIQSVRDIWQDIQKGLPSDPLTLAQDALSLLFPFPVDALKGVRGELNRLLVDLKPSLFDPSLSASLRASLAQIQIHANAGDQAALDLALANYGAQFTSFRTNLQAACQNVPARITAWNLEALRKPAETLFALARTGKPDGLQFMHDLKSHLTHFEMLLGHADAEKAQAIFAKVNGYLDSLEAFLKSVYLDRIDQGIEFLKSLVRDLFEPLRLRAIQTEISLFFDNLVDAINQADLGSYSETLRTPFKALGEKLEGLDLGQHLDQQLATIGNSIGSVVTTIQSQLTIIDNALTGLVDQVKAIFQQLGELLDQFGDAIEEVNKGIESLDIEGVTDEVIKALQDLRAKGEELLAKAPIPEPMKPLIEQLIKQLEDMDLENLIKQPARDALVAFDLPDSVKAPLENAMPELQKLLSNVMPEKLVAELQAELAGHLKAITDLAAKSMGDVVNGFFGELQKGMDVIDPSKLVDLLRIPFLKILETFDRLNPETLLQPVTKAYDDFLTDIGQANPAAAAQKTQSAIGKTGKAMGQAAAAPVKAMSSPGKVRDWKPEDKTTQPLVPELKPGDIIRQLLGKPLQKLREALAGLDETTAGQFLGKFQDLTSQLARDIRTIRARLSGLQGHLEIAGDDLLNDLVDAEFDARFAMESQIRLGNLSVDTQIQIFSEFNTTDVYSDLGTALATHRQLVAETVQNQWSGIGETLDGIADLLENHRITSFASSFQGLLEAVDPEPIAAALDSLAQAATGKFVELTGAIDGDLTKLFNRIKQLIRQYNPALQIQRLSEVIAVFWEEMALLNPHFWVDEIKPVHQAIRSALTAYDPANWTSDLVGEIDALKAKLTAIDPTSLLDPGQLNPFQTQANGAAAIDLTKVGQGLKVALGDLTAGLEDLDPAILLDTVTQLKERMLAQLDPVVDAIHQEMLTLLKSLRYVTTSVSASASVSV